MHTTRTVRCLLGLAALPLIAMSLLAPAPAGASTDVERSVSKDYLAEGSSYIACPDSPYSEYGGFVVEEVWLGKGYGDYYKLVYGRYDSNCSQPGYHAVYGQAEPTTYSIDPRMASAHAEATIPLFNEQTGAPEGSICLNVTWTATGSPRTYSDNQVYRSPGHVEVYHFSITKRPAVLTGLVVDTATISHKTNAEVVIQH